jgi:hypothetical protein
MVMQSTTRWRRLSLFYGLAVVAGVGLVHAVYYELLQAKRQHPQHSVMVFDLGGMSHFSQQNLFPGSWSTEQTKLITGACYQPVAWDAYWTQQPCLFVMQKLESEGTFGTPTLTAAWRHAVFQHPIAYLTHRAYFFWTFLFGGNNLTLWMRDLSNPDKIAFSDRPLLMAMKQIHDVLKPTPLFNVGAWLIANFAFFIIALRRADGPARRITLALSGSAILYVGTFAIVGVATDFRYAYWSVLSALIGGALITSQSAKSASIA